MCERIIKSMVAVRGHKSIAFVFADQRTSFDKKKTLIH